MFLEIKPCWQQSQLLFLATIKKVRRGTSEFIYFYGSLGGSFLSLFLFSWSVRDSPSLLVIADLCSPVHNYDNHNTRVILIHHPYISYQITKCERSKRFHKIKPTWNIIVAISQIQENLFLMSELQMLDRFDRLNGMSPFYVGESVLRLDKHLYIHAAVKM